MPLIGSPEEPAVEIPPKPVAQEIETAVQQTTGAVATTVVNTLEGYPLTVTAYMPIAGLNDDVSPLDLSKPATLQSYTKIESLEVRVTQPLTASYDAETDSQQYTMSCTFYPGLTPTINAYLLLNGPDGNPILMRMTSVTPLSYMTTTVHNVELTQASIGYTEELENIESKEATTSHFMKDRLEVGLNPILTSEEYTQSLNLNELYKSLRNQYMGSFYDMRERTIVYLHDGKRYYDQPLVEFLREFDREFLKHCEILPVKSLAPQHETFWDGILKMDRLKISMSRHSYSWMRGDRTTSMRPVGDRYSDVMVLSDSILHQLSLTGDEVVEGLINPFDSTSYVLEEAYYYESDYTANAFTELLDRHMAKDHLDRVKLEQLVNESKDWPAQYRFYLQPILLCMIAMEIRK